jgi:hypothetical protein
MVVVVLFVEQNDDKIGHMDPYELVVVEVIQEVIVVVLVAVDNYDLVMNVVVVDRFAMPSVLMIDLMKRIFSSNDL